METLNLKEHGEQQGGYDELVIWDNRIWKLILIHRHDISKTLVITVEDSKGDRLIVSFIIPLKGYYEKYDFLEKKWDKDCAIWKEMLQ